MSSPGLRHAPPPSDSSPSLATTPGSPWAAGHLVPSPPRLLPWRPCLADLVPPCGSLGEGEQETAANTPLYPHPIWALFSEPSDPSRRSHRSVPPGITGDARPDGSVWERRSAGPFWSMRASWHPRLPLRRVRRHLRRVSGPSKFAWLPTPRPEEQTSRNPRISSTIKAGAGHRERRSPRGCHLSPRWAPMTRTNEA